MDAFDRILKAACRALSVVAGSSLVLLMALTILDVVLRGFRTPVPGTYELVAFAGALVIGLAMPFTQRARGHIYVEIIVEKLPRRARDGFRLATRLLAIGIFAVIGWNLVKYGAGLMRSGEVSLTLQMPFWPFAFALALGCLFQCLVCIGEIARIFGGRYE
jgi:TRAP-type C4-dicarboxylate transport system permease small subunit